MSTTDQPEPVSLGFANGDPDIMVTTIDELDAALDAFERQARGDEPRVVLMSTDGGDNRLAIGVGADLVPVTHDDDISDTDEPYVRSQGDLANGEPTDWAYSNMWNPVPPTWLVPAASAREAARRWLVTHQRPDNIRFVDPGDDPDDPFSGDDDDPPDGGSDDAAPPDGGVSGDFGARAGDRKATVRESVAADPAAPSDILVLLAEDRDDDVRAAVAANPATPPDIVARFAVDPDGYLRAATARNPAASADLLRSLVHDEYRATKVYLVKNPSSPPDVLDLLAQDDDDIVAGLVERQRWKNRQ